MWKLQQFGLERQIQVLFHCSFEENILTMCSIAKYFSPSVVKQRSLIKLLMHPVRLQVHNNIKEHCWWVQDGEEEADNLQWCLISSLLWLLLLTIRMETQDNAFALYPCPENLHTFLWSFFKKILVGWQMCHLHFILLYLIPDYWLCCSRAICVWCLSLSVLSFVVVVFVWKFVSEATRISKRIINKTKYFKINSLKFV